MFVFNRLRPANSHWSTKVCKLCPKSCIYDIQWKNKTFDQHSSSSKHGELNWCQRAWFGLIWPQHFHPVLLWIIQMFIGKLQMDRYMCLLEQGDLAGAEDFQSFKLSCVTIVFLVTMVPAALRSFTRSSRVVLGCFLTVLMIIESPRGEILHAAPVRALCMYTISSLTSLESSLVLAMVESLESDWLIDCLCRQVVFYTGNKPRIPLRECSYPNLSSLVV